MYKKNQAGVGLVEVLVALLLLTIGVLGFTALQLRAVDASQEAVERSNAMNLARDLAERIRINRTALLSYQKAINAQPTSTICDGSGVGYLPNCNPESMASYDAAEILNKAKETGQTIKIYDCIGSTMQCIYVAWGNTNTAQNNIYTDSRKCISSETGTYIIGSQCLVMEAFDAN